MKSRILDEGENMIYLGHTSEDGRKQLLKEHLNNTAEGCKKFAASFNSSELGYTIGLYHDIGKYSAGFQKHLNAKGPKVDHSTAGAKEMMNRYNFPPAAFCIAGHHAGLSNCGNNASSPGDGTLRGRLKKDLNGTQAYGNFRDEMNCTIANVHLPQFDKMGNQCFGWMAFTRMLFSCLVDADYLDTESFMTENRIKRGEFSDINVLSEKLDAYIKTFWPPKNKINKKRCEILNECLNKALEEPGLFSLTVPTGGGKTIASLAFALHHAMKYGKKRIIYVIPYTSIIEQTADVFRNIVGKDNVVEHHMNVTYEDNEGININNKFKLATENWDAPIIVTTNVQFFESLYGNRTSSCRKIHNVVNSVLIFDEAQMLPNDFLKPCTRMIAELVKNYGVTAVLCTATQPSLNNFFPKNMSIKEICRDVRGLYSFFKRVKYEIHHFNTILDLSNELNKCRQVLCIVNIKKDAQKIYDSFAGENKFHLSTFMYPEHRKQVLAKIRKCLKEDIACQVVSTSLIEAGVDVDFPIVYREIAGLDNIIQAGGRCNREGKASVDESKVVIFDIAEKTRVPSYIKLPMEITKMIAKSNIEDISSTLAIETYFQKLHYFKGSSLDKENIIEMSDDGTFPFKEIAEKFKIIKESSISVFIPTDEKSKKIENQLRQGLRSKALLRAAGMYSVGVYEKQYEQLLATGKVEAIDASLSILLDINSYDRNKGLVVKLEDGIGIFA